MNELIPVVELLRVSGAGQAQDDSLNLAGQHTENERTCTRYGLRIVETVSAVVSGAEVATHPAMHQVLAAVESGRARGVVLAEYSRFFRPDRWTDLAALQVLHDRNAPIYLPNGPIDLQTDAGHIQATVLNMGAALERRNIARRMQRGKEEARSRGGHAGGQSSLPLGVAYAKGHGWSYTADADRVRDLFRLFLSGEERSYTALEERLGLGHNCARNLLTNPTYAGRRVYATRKVKVGGKQVSVRCAAGDVRTVDIALPPLIDAADFERVQAIVAAKREGNLRPARGGAEMLYRGFLRCAACESGIYSNNKPQTDGSPRWFYFCRSHLAPYNRSAAAAERCGFGYVRREVVEPMLDRAILAHLLDVDVLTDALLAYEDALRSDVRVRLGADPDELARRLDAARRKRGRVMDLWIEGRLDSKEERDRRLAGVEAEISAAETALAACAPAAPLPAVTAEFVQMIVGTFYRWERLRREDRRLLLEALSPTFYVNPGRVRGVSFSFGALAVLEPKALEKAFATLGTLQPRKSARKPRGFEPSASRLARAAMIAHPRRMRAD